MRISFYDRVIARRASNIILQAIVHYGTDDLLFSQESKAIARPVIGAIDMGSFDAQEITNKRILLLVNDLSCWYFGEYADRTKEQYNSNE